MDGLVKHNALAVRRRALAVRSVLLLVALCYLRAELRRQQRIPLALSAGPRQPFLAFTGAGLLWAYYHGIITYIRDHFHVEDLRISAISGGCVASTLLCMGLDLYQAVLLGLHMKSKVLRHGIYFHSCSQLADFFLEHLQVIGITDWDVERLAARRQLFVGVTQCFPPRHRCVAAPRTLKDLIDLWVCSMCVPPFLRSPGTFQGRRYVDGGFSAVWSIPEGQPPEEVLKITCVPGWCTWCPLVMDYPELQPAQLWLSSIFFPHPWRHQRKLIKLGYDDAKSRHGLFLEHGLRPLAGAPLTSWSEWQRLFDGIDEDNLPELSHLRSTDAASSRERAHDELLRTYSASNLAEMLETPRCLRLSSCGSQSHDSIVRVARSSSRSLPS